MGNWFYLPRQPPPEEILENAMIDHFWQMEPLQQDIFLDKIASCVCDQMMQAIRAKDEIDYKEGRAVKIPNYRRAHKVRPYYKVCTFDSIRQSV